MVMLFALPPDPPPIIGRASVIDGDTLEIHGQRIRLWGIDAPEGRQTCILKGQAYRCGQQSAAALEQSVRNRTVTCTQVGRPDRYRRIVATCTVEYSLRGTEGTEDIAGRLVHQGRAVDYPLYSQGAYADAQARAREQRLGMWAGEFQMPWEWRSSPE